MYISDEHEEELSSYDRGTTCYKGIEVEGVSNPEELGFDHLGLRRVQCELGQVCSNSVATAVLPGGPQTGMEYCCFSIEQCVYE